MASRAKGLSRQLRGEWAMLVAVGLALFATLAIVLQRAGSEFGLLLFLGALPVVGAAILLGRSSAPRTNLPERVIDWSLVRAAIEHDTNAVAVTDRSGRLVCRNDAFVRLFGADATPPDLPLIVDGKGALASAVQDGWRNGEARVEARTTDGVSLTVSCRRGGQGNEGLFWQFTRSAAFDAEAVFARALSGHWGDQFGEAGIMAVLIGGEGRVRAANRAFLLRAGRGAGEGADLASLLMLDKANNIRFAEESAAGTTVRVLQIPLDGGHERGSRLIILLDEDQPLIEAGADGALHTLLSMLPVGLALADRDGRFLYVNQTFMRAAGVPAGTAPVYPSDLVIAEDKAAVADTVRRFALGRSSQGDVAVRLASRPDDPVALTVAGARGLGEAAVLLSLRDNSEESRLKREVAQATKMQAVGQLAGGVAHDFNNILTGIIGHCDLMLLRHSPGDSDYDDIQQIRINSNRAAALTRQLLAFSRQQTLRPQVLQLPDVVSDVSSLLQRLLGERVELIIQHGRGMGAVRADPGQLEQVIVNLAVNARDAMPDGGTLTLQTYAVSAADVRRLGSDVLPIAQYTALKMSDTGTGIPPEILGKIFEPFFTTKEVGKGTGLGLSTVYGIVKQSGGFIFAESHGGHGTDFTIYLPVYADTGERAEPAAKPVETPVELWGTGHVLLVEDEDMVRAVAERALTRHGYTVTTAANGEEALELLPSLEQIDLLVSDVVMPSMDGPTLVRQVREQLPDLPILFMSGYAEEQLRRSIDLDQVQFLAKPFSVKQLAEAAQRALMQRTETAARQVT